MALKRIRKAIADGRKFEAVDDDTPGAKDTFVTWGACSIHKEDWPDAEDHLWPVRFLEEGCVAPKYMEGLPCPYDKDRARARDQFGGCFYRCTAFDKKDRNRKDRKRIIGRFDKVIKQLEGEVNGPLNN